MKLIYRQQGMSLVELMIAMLLSLLVAQFIMNILLHTNKTAMQAELRAEAQEYGRFALNWLQHNIRRAGYPGTTKFIHLSPVSPICGAGNSSPPANNGHCSYDSNSSENGGDRVALHRITTELDNKDCSGAEILGLEDQTEVVDLYWVSDQTLWCATYLHDGRKLSPAQAITLGIEAVQVLYATATDHRFRALQDIAEYEVANIKALKVAVLSHSLAVSATDVEKRAYVLLNSAPLLYEDGRSRYVLSTTIYLPN